MGSVDPASEWTRWSRANFEPNVMRCAGRISHRPIDRLFLGLLVERERDSNKFEYAVARIVPLDQRVKFGEMCVSD